VVSAYANELLTQNYYDDYTWVSGSAPTLGSTMATNYTSNSNWFITSFNASPIYAVASNKLMGVTDAVDNNNTLLGNFHYNPTTKQATDYNYDGNGNLTQDNNKVISSITFNYLNLPQLVHFSGKGNIAYTYDAAGTKLAKVTTDSVARHSTTILYVGPFVYQQNDSITIPEGGVDTLQFVGHEEGRTRWAYHKFTTGTTAYKFEYDFFERDNLGNTRTILTQERDTTNYLASMEYQYRTTELQLFGNIANTCAAWTSMPNESTNIPNNIRYAYTSPNDSVSRVDSSSAGGQKTGPNLLLKVMSGDSVNLSVQCYYTTPGGGSTNYSSFSDVLTSLGQGLVNLTGAAHGTLGNLESSGSSVYTGLSSFLSSDDTAHSGYPKAYINWIFLDDQFNYVSSLSGSVLAASSTYPGNQMNLVAPGSPLALNRNGYLYIWVSNETSGWDVFFDDLSVQYKQGPLLEENHYYPYGLTMAGISDKAIKTNYAVNKYRFNGVEMQNQEFSDGSGLEEYDFGARMQDPQLGLWHAVDPLAAATAAISPYSYALDNPVNFVDVGGMKAAPMLSYNLQYQAYQNSLGTHVDNTYWSWNQGEPQGGGGGESGAGSSGTSDGSGSNGGSSIVDYVAAAMKLLNTTYGGQVFWTPNGVTTQVFTSSDEAISTAASELYLSGYWGTGQNAANGFYAAQAAYKAITGEDLGLSLPVVDIGYHNGNNWVTMNMNQLMDQLKLNGALGEGANAFSIVGNVNDGMGTTAETVGQFSKGGAVLEATEFISKGATLLGPAITVTDAFVNGYKPHQVADLTADLVIYGIAEASGPVGWVVGGLWFLGNLAYEHYHGGRSITEDAFDPH